MADKGEKSQLLKKDLYVTIANKKGKKITGKEQRNTTRNKVTCTELESVKQDDTNHYFTLWACCILISLVFVVLVLISAVMVVVVVVVVVVDVVVEVFYER